MSKLLRNISGIFILFAVIALVGWSVGKKPSPAMPDALGTVIQDVSGFPSPTPIPYLSITGIFSDDHTWVQSLPKEKAVTMMATGDVIPARSVNHKMVTKSDFLWPFKKTANELETADITVINLETPLLTACPVAIEGMKFCGDAQAIKGLAYAGVDVATLGNNHAGNYGLKGIEETKEVLTGGSILPVAEGVEYKEAKGTRFAFLSYNDIGAIEPGIPWADETGIRHDINEARSKADVVVVAFHWGVEYSTEPTQRQKDLAHIAVDAGADVVLGNHPHWIQPVEIYRDKFINYAYGNFIFDQEWSKETKQGVVGRYTFFEGRLVDVEFLPTGIEDYGQAYFLDGKERQNILDAMKAASVSLIK